MFYANGRLKRRQRQNFAEGIRTVSAPYATLKLSSFNSTRAVPLDSFCRVDFVLLAKKLVSMLGKKKREFIVPARGPSTIWHTHSHVNTNIRLFSAIFHTAPVEERKRERMYVCERRDKRESKRKGDRKEKEKQAQDKEVVQL